MTGMYSNRGGKTLAKAVQESYANNQTDYSLEPIILVDQNQKQIGAIHNSDSVIFCCRRGEREIQLTEAFTQPEYSYFSRQYLNDLYFVILTLYHEKFKELPVAFAPNKITNTLGQIVSEANLRQFRTSESEKFAHITFFLNGGNNQPYKGEEDVRISSPRGIPFNQIPELCLDQVKQELISAFPKNYDLIITNFANGDVIGHTSDNNAKIKCAEIVDYHLGEVVQEAKQNGYVTLIVADHGNLEVMTNPDGTPHVAHTINLVPFILIEPHGNPTNININDGKLADIAPTILHLLRITTPVEMDGNNLIPNSPFNTKQKVLLIILDGWGFGNDDSTNPIFLAKTPNWDELLLHYPNSKLQASGNAVGLKPGKAGNSEAGHMNIGAGRTILQDDVRLDQAMKDQTFFYNPIVCKAINRAKEKHSALHLIGLLTEKSSHGSIDYPLAILKMAKAMGFTQVYLHMILDGRSTEPGSAPELLCMLEEKMSAIDIGLIVSCIGRGIALDRDENYPKTQRAYDAMTAGIGKKTILV